MTKTIPSDNAQAFLKNLDPINEELDGFYFRGQANALWEAIPSIWRDQKELYEGFKKNLTSEEYNQITKKIEHLISGTKINKNTLEKWIFHIKFENYLLKNFYEIVNTAGLLISDEEFNRIYRQLSYYAHGFDLSGTDNILSDYRRYLETGTPPFSQRNPIVYESGLPQHNHLPTRLLDITTDPRKAAFMAAYSYLHLNCKNSIKEIAVYAIKAITPHSPITILSNHMRHKNKFLHSQDGLFIQIHGDFYYFENEQWPSLESLQKRYGDHYFEIKKYTLPVTEIMNLLKKLEKCGITISTMMPDYSHVSEQIKTMTKTPPIEASLTETKSEHTFSTTDS